MKLMLALAFASLAAPAIAADCDADDWAGRWDTAWGWLELDATGGTMSGNYEYQGGTVTGTLDTTACVLTGKWSQGADLDNGVFELNLAPSGDAFRGEWLSSRTGIDGPWNGVRASGAGN